MCVVYTHIFIHAHAHRCVCGAVGIMWVHGGLVQVASWGPLLARGECLQVSIF